MSSLDNLVKSAQSNTKRIVLPESSDPRILEAAKIIAAQNIAEVILVGDPASIFVSGQLDSAMSGVSIVDAANTDQFNDYQTKLHELRKHKGMTLDQAKDALQNPLTFAATMVATGDADGCVAGAINTTSDVVRTALQVIGMKTGNSLVSSFFIMEHSLSHHPFSGTSIYADCALVIEPDASQLASIAIASVDSARSLLGLEAVAALLSFSTAGSATHPNVEKVVAAGEIISASRPDIPLMTEVQFDAALYQDVLAQKAPKIDVKAPANVFIFPDLQSGNIGYKIAQRIGGVNAIGPILQGLKHPVNDLSRGCSVDDIVKLVAVTSVQSNS